MSKLDNDVCKLVFPYHYGKTYKNYIKLFILHKNFILVKQNKKLKKSFVWILIISNCVITFRLTFISTCTVERRNSVTITVLIAIVVCLIHHISTPYHSVGSTGGIKLIIIITIDCLEMQRIDKVVSSRISILLTICIETL